MTGFTAYILKKDGIGTIPNKRSIDPYVANLRPPGPDQIGRTRCDDSSDDDDPSMLLLLRLLLTPLMPSLGSDSRS